MPPGPSDGLPIAKGHPSVELGCPFLCVYSSSPRSRTSRALEPLRREREATLLLPQQLGRAPPGVFQHLFKQGGACQTKAGQAVLAPQAPGQPQVQHGKLSKVPAGAVVHRGVPLQEPFQVPGVVEPPSPEKGVRPRPKAQVLLPPPVQQVVTAFPSRSGEVADLILGVSQLAQLLHQEQVLLGGFLVIRQLDSPGGKGCARLHF